MNCPGHCFLFGSHVAVSRSAHPASGGLDPPSRRAERDAPRAPAGPPFRPGRRAHLLHAGADRRRDLACLDYAHFLYDLFELEVRYELSTRPEDKLGTDEEWDFTEAALERALARTRASTTSRTRARGLLRPQDRPPHDGLLGRELADGHRPARFADAAAVRSRLRGRRQSRSTRRPWSTVPCSARSSASSES